MSNNLHSIRKPGMQRRIIAALAITACIEIALLPQQSAAVTPTMLQDGSSMVNAIPIKAPNEKTGVTAEYRWIAEHFPGYRRGAQALLNNNGRFYDAINITTASGEHRKIFFDITDYFGKM